MLLTCFLMCYVLLEFHRLWYSVWILRSCCISTWIFDCISSLVKCILFWCCRFVICFIDNPILFAQGWVIVLSRSSYKLVQIMLFNFNIVSLLSILYVLNDTSKYFRGHLISLSKLYWSQDFHLALGPNEYKPILIC